MLAGILLIAGLGGGPLSPVDVYKHAVMAMHAIADPPYLQFNVEMRTAHATKIIDNTYVDVERTIDRRTWVRASASDSHARAVTLPIPPDLFLNPARLPEQNEGGLSSGLDSTAAAQPKTIAAIEAVGVHYTVTQVGVEALPECESAIHLQLTPIESPLRYNLRDLWVNTENFHICRASAIWRAPVITHDQDIPVTLDVNSAGFIEHWSLTATARALFGSYTINQEASYREISAAAPQTWSALNGH